MFFKKSKPGCLSNKIYMYCLKSSASIYGFFVFFNAQKQRFTLDIFYKFYVQCLRNSFFDILFYFILVGSIFNATSVLNWSGSKSNLLFISQNSEIDITAVELGPNIFVINKFYDFSVVESTGAPFGKKN